MNLCALVGNEALKRQLDAQCARRGLSHADILSGAPGSGKRTLAGLLAQALVCTGGGEDLPCGGNVPCGACSGCRKAAAGIHPDIIRVGTDGKDITVAQVRALRADAYIRPNEAARKVYVVENAQSMNPSAQNALLKRLEEGPAYAAFLLLADNAAALLPTVRSRCEGLSLSPVGADQAAAFLRARYPDRDPGELERAAAACGGILGRAVSALEGGGQEDEAVRIAARTVLERLANRDELALQAYCVELEKWGRDALCALLDELILLLRDALVCAGGGPDEADPQRRALARAAAQRLSPKTLMAAAGTAEQLRTACGYNVGAGHLCGWLCAALSELNS